MKVKGHIFNSPLFKVFLALSLADFGLTTWLLLAHPEWVVESNPVANWWLNRFGFIGLAGFKLGTVGLVGLVCYRLMKLRPRLAQGVLVVACLTVLTVVGYSTYLGIVLQRQTNQLAALEQQDRELDLKRLKLNAYFHLAEELCKELASGQTTLRNAVNHLINTEYAQNPDWIEQMKRVFDSNSLPVCVAKNLIERFRLHPSYQNGPIVEKLEQQLWREFADELQYSSSKSDSLSL